MMLNLFQINTFTNQFDGGNPAGVIPLDDWLADTAMQAIAKENGFSETAFFVANGEAFDLRWFTPGCEVDLCGHATLATAFVLANEMGIKRDRYTFHTRSGKVAVWRAIGVQADDNRFTLDFPANQLQPVSCPAAVVSGLDLASDAMSLECYLADDYLVVFDDEATIMSLQPDFSCLHQMGTRGLIVTAPSDRDGIDFVSRWFGGADVGVDEDPVTGSAHCSLIPYWARRLHKQQLEALQVSRRQGRISCELNGNRVYITGEAIVYFRGEIIWPVD